jgi:voltage-gated potassium channel
MFARVFRSRRDDLLLIAVLLLVLLVLSSSTMYFLENAAQPETFSSIPAAMWWAMATLTTVGYGDVIPATPLGKFVGAFIAVLGIGFFALPAGILAAAFAEELRRQKTSPATACPHCGKPIAGGAAAT